MAMPGGVLGTLPSLGMRSTTGLSAKANRDARPKTRRLIRVSRLNSADRRRAAFDDQAF